MRAAAGFSAPSTDLEKTVAKSLSPRRTLCALRARTCLNGSAAQTVQAGHKAEGPDEGQGPQKRRASISDATLHIYWHVFLRSQTTLQARVSPQWTHRHESRGPRQSTVCEALKQLDRVGLLPRPPASRSPRRRPGRHEARESTVQDTNAYAASESAAQLRPPPAGAHSARLGPSRGAACWQPPGLLVDERCWNHPMSGEIAVLGLKPRTTKTAA